MYRFCLLRGGCEKGARVLWPFFFRALFCLLYTLMAFNRKRGSFTSRKNIYNGLSVNFRQILFETIELLRIALNKINFAKVTLFSERRNEITPVYFFMLGYYSAPLDRFYALYGVLMSSCPFESVAVIFFRAPFWQRMCYRSVWRVEGDCQ